MKQKKRVLFVDDEPGILEGLRNRLRRQRAKWEMLFVSSGKEALELMARDPVEVLITDMRMPEMDGAELLKRTRESHPQTVRIILSGHAEVESALKAVSVAHQYLTKPCESGLLENVVERACSLQSLINDEVLQRVVGRIDKLPSPPKIYSQLLAVIKNETTTNEDITKILQQDMAICAKMLQVVNSAFFRLPRTIVRIEEAVNYLGFDTIKQIALAVEVFQQSGSDSNTGMAIATLQEHAMQVADLASSFFAKKQEKEDAFVAGLLHDIGKLVLYIGMPDWASKVRFEMETNAESEMYRAEQRVYGTTHAEVGGYLLGLWGLPYPVVEAVCNHHEPLRVDSKEFGLLAATHIANGIVHGAKMAPERENAESLSILNLEYCDHIGVSENLFGWFESARERFVTNR